MDTRLLLSLTLAVLAPPLVGQRGSPEFEHQKRRTVIDYGAVNVGKYSLASLEIGATWRLGNDNASTWMLEMPILAGDVMLVPGHYRIGLVRETEDRLYVALAGSALAPGSGGELRIAGALEEIKKPGKKLEISFESPRKAERDGTGCPVELHVGFGASAWVAPLRVLDGERTTRLGGGWTLDVFAIPGDRINARAQRPLVVATLRKKNLPNDAPEGWNLVLGGTNARLVPWMKAPTDSYGFAEPTAPDATWATEGTVAEEGGDAPKDGQTSEQEPPLELGMVAAKKGTFSLELRVGARKLTVEIPAPTPPKK